MTYIKLKNIIYLFLITTQMISIGQSSITEKQKFATTGKFDFESKSSLQKTSSFADVRVNDQIGNSQKLNVKTAINNNDISLTVWDDYREGTQNIYGQLQNKNGELIGENMKINFPDDGKAYSNPDVAVNDENQFLVVWFDNRASYSIYGQLISEDGSFLSENIQVNDANSTRFKIRPTIASNGEEFVVAWADSRLGSNYDIYAQRLNSNGSKIGENFIVNTDTQSVKKDYADISIDASGKIFTAWNSTINGAWTSFSVLRNAENNVITKQTQLSSDLEPNKNHYYPKVSQSASGFVAAWQSYLAGKSNIVIQKVDTMGIPIDSNIIVNDIDASSRNTAVVSADSAGNFRVSWNDFRNGYAQVYGQEFSNDTLSGVNFKISEDEKTAAKAYLSCDVNKIGNLIIAWLDFGEKTEYQVLTKIICTDGEPLPNSTRVDVDSHSSLESDPTIGVFDDGSSIVVWTDRRFRAQNAYFQRFDSEGNKVGENRAASSSGSNYKPKVLTNKDGNFTIFWREYYRDLNNQNEIIGQKFFNTGETVGEKFIVSNNSNKGSADYVDVAGNSAGEYVLAWEKRIDGKTRIFAQKYDSQGSSLERPIKVSNDSTANYYRPRVGIDSLGNFAITYYGYVNNNNEIFLNHYNSNAELIDSVITVNDDLENSSQYYPDISVNFHGECIIAWFDYRSTNGIFFQKYKNIGSAELFEKIDSNISVTDYSISFTTPKVSMENNGEFIVTWSERSSESNDIKFVAFNSSSEPITDIIYVSDSQVRNQINNDLIFNNGKIFNVWQDNKEPSVGYDIWANVIDLENLITDINNIENNIPNNFTLEQNYPNPFNPSTIINYTIPNIQSTNTYDVKLIIYDVLGREIKTLVNKKQNAGKYKVELNGSDLSSGVYFYSLSAGEFLETKKMLLLK